MLMFFERVLSLKLLLFLVIIIHYFVEILTFAYKSSK